MSQIDKVKMVDNPKTLKTIFFKRVNRKVKHDRTISLNNILYEEGKMIGQAKKVIFADNARIKRKGNISFKNIIKKGDN